MISTKMKNMASYDLNNKTTVTMDFKVKYEVGIHKMQKVTFPPIRTGVHVSVAAKEPPERSWSKYKKVLIDNPKDSNLLQRQKLWNFQKLNRGAFRSQLASLPDIPYRVQPNPVEKVSVGVQADLTNRFSQNLRVIFPNLVDKRKRSSLDQTGTETNDSSNNQTELSLKLSKPASNADDYSDDFDEESFYDDPGLEFDTVVRKKNAGTMTDTIASVKPAMKREKKLRSFRERNTSMYKYKLPILKSNEQTPRVTREAKSVKFEREIIAQETDDEDEKVNVESAITTPEAEELEEILSAVSKVEITEIPERVRVPSPASSVDSRVPKIPLENIGPSSNLATDPVSILDYISGNLSNRSRNSENGGKKRRTKFVSDPEADRVWFEKIVGDKEIIDSGTYENFARSRPNVDDQTDSNNEKYTDLTRNSPRKNFTPRINDEFAVYHSVVAKSTKKPSNNAPANTNKGKNLKRGLINIGKSY
ncbi:uncharacterized protein LOC123534387 [Mercenaria mercenaria]|uniref:uncharacterized protein LOC123534387 n=1 Tax=Mercenaria mercenaria TaxID=6596 RepID=UPI00234E4A8D|nr:uncharacterized protein LOC123534387 [Mercenaria mercenaria]XP_053375083.1 uncharacterized protein LOC123534387 [Mercenaria mercenaria]